jgi:hypothetical protein
MANRTGGPPPASRPHLTDAQRGRVGRAREVAGKDIRDIAPGRDDPGEAAGYACGVMRAHVGFLLEVIDELAGGGK